MTAKMTKPVLTRAHRVLISVVVAGAVIIAAIGFAGSYTAVRELAVEKGFGDFSYFFPIGIDAGICVLLALDLLLTWIRIPFPLLRQTAWVLTAATIAFNGAAAWPDPLGVGMHAVIPMLFVVAVEAARHAVGRIADITADKHMEGVRLTRWLLSPIPTFRLWRRMKLWEIRSYEQAIRLEQHRLVYQAKLQREYGRSWRRKAPVETLMPLRLAKYGVPLAQTAPDVLTEAGLDLSLGLDVVTVARADVQPDATGGVHQRALETGAHVAAGQPEAPAAVDVVADDVAGAPEGSEGTEFDLADACRVYLEDYGVFPEADSFAAFLAEAYGVTDPQTGGLVSSAWLSPLLSELRQELGEPETGSESAEPATGFADDQYSGPAAKAQGIGLIAVGGEGGESHPFFGPATQQAPVEPAPAPAPLQVEPALVPTALADVEYGAGGGVAQQTVLDVPVSGPVQAPAAEPHVWEASVTDTGAATARLPEQQTDEPELGPVQQQIVTVAQWLIEAEEAGEKLSGAEVARRLNLSPRTGQRRLDKATEYLDEQRRQQGRAHLRSVRT